MYKAYLSGLAGRLCGIPCKWRRNIANIAVNLGLLDGPNPIKVYIICKYRQNIEWSYIHSPPNHTINLWLINLPIHNKEKFRKYHRRKPCFNSDQSWDGVHTPIEPETYFNFYSFLNVQNSNWDDSKSRWKRTFWNTI